MDKEVDKVEAYHGEMTAKIDALKAELTCEKMQSIDCFVECVDIRKGKEKAEAELAEAKVQHSIVVNGLLEQIDALKGG